MRRLALLLAFAAARPVAALPQAGAVERAEALARAGDYAAARSALARWWQEAAAAAAPADGGLHARALLLRASLATDRDTAQADYLALVLGYPTAPQASEALLRLGQGLLAAGDTSRGLAYLERLAADYPQSPSRAAGLLWLARAYAAGRQGEEACRAAARGLAAPSSDADLVTMLRAEERRHCLAVRPAPAPPARAAAARYAVQAGAFRARAGAEKIASELRSAGFEPRIVYVAGSELIRVRVGRFGSRADADALARRINAAGLEGFVVADAGAERAPVQ
ncbi:MAG: SPOR domain-containing protein [Gemmatimonadetes bacterium]|nr:SPOR domain-containing protein [Gemmatimonadota bacterium]